jgi:hypothetical protein
MWTFLLALVLVFVAVDLLVKFVIDPLASKKWKKNKVIDSKEEIIQSSMGFVGATMFDGGKAKETENLNSKTGEADIKKEELPG